ncbi:DUF2290 domain-containing protein [Lacrimispora sp.]|uniref:DUF2290 domain-containing protein n=1 Tax=Lacrimispora sp. TaxID=2719234 RepID=UPI0028A7542B|nr:DUF2290 domain-containing protein [Lacrimispora sp.]
MSTPRIVKEIISDIRVTKEELLKIGIVKEAIGESVTCKGHNDYAITWSTKNDTSSIIYDKDISIDELIDGLLINNQYSFLLYDKSIIQIEYMVKNNKICKQRLLFIKKHNKIWDKKLIDQFDEGDDVYYSDWFRDNVGIPTVLRIDYDVDEHVECKHAISHMTLSNNQCCRIPIRGLVSCTEFLRLILFHFYDLNFSVNKFDYATYTITNKEQEMLHMSWK